MEMGSPRVEEIIAALGWLALTPGEQRKAKPPELTPLTLKERFAIGEAIAAVEMGIDAGMLLDEQIQVEMSLQRPRDRQRGEIVPHAELPPVLEILRRHDHALVNCRVAHEFLFWLRTEASNREASAAMRLLKGRDADPTRFDEAVAAFAAVDAFMHAGMTKGEAVRAVAAGKVAPARPCDSDGLCEIRALPIEGRFGFGAVPVLGPMTVGKVLYLLRKAGRSWGVPPQRVPHKRPGRNKRETPGNPVYSGPKSAQKAGLSTLPPRRSTDAEGKRDDDLPHDNRSRRPAQGAAPNPPGVEAQREGAAILQAVRKPRAVRGRGAEPLPRGSDVRSHGRGDGSARKRPGRVKGPP